MRSSEIALGPDFHASEIGLGGHRLVLARSGSLVRIIPVAAVKSQTRESVEIILIALLVALVVRTYLVTGYKVPTSSMAPVLLPGDFIFVYRPPGGAKIPLLSLKIGSQIPRRNELVVFTFAEQPHTNYVKRVIGLPGDNIQMRDGKLIINDHPLQYSLANQDSLTNLPNSDQFEVWEEKDGTTQRKIVRKKGGRGEDFGPLVVPPEEVFMLGDHRDASDDSRYWGTVPIQRIEGRVFLIWLSLDWEKKWGENRFPSLRTERLFTSVH